MGFGLPSAVGAKVAAPNKMVIDIDGDASFSMTAMELATASQFNIGVKVMVLNNEFQGMVLQWQGLYPFPRPEMHAKRVLADLFYDHRYSHTRMTNPDFVLLAKAMGVHAIRVSSASELQEKMKEFLEYDGNKPVLLECVVEPNEHVFPMVDPLKSISSLVADPVCCTGSGRQGAA
jgi:acetolactate synthase-1/2/3 large subunit